MIVHIRNLLMRHRRQFAPGGWPRRQGDNRAARATQ